MAFNVAFTTSGSMMKGFLKGFVLIAHNVFLRKVNMYANGLKRQSSTNLFTGITRPGHNTMIQLTKVLFYIQFQLINYYTFHESFDEHLDINFDLFVIIFPNLILGLVSEDKCYSFAILLFVCACQKFILFTYKHILLPSM